ncbi:MAG: hypothetical protein O2851_08445 [Proteobacteria bacterium]|nr:hypothetical protein [Pseudomonadota bacterium]
MSVIKVGLTWSSDRLPGTTFRAGVSLGDQPMQPGEVLFNVLAPGVMEQHLTFGIARELGNGKEWGATFMLLIHPLHYAEVRSLPKRL